MGKVVFARDVSAVSAPTVDETKLEFQTSVSSAYFSYAAGDVVDRDDFDEDRVYFWLNRGVVEVYEEPGGEVLFSYKAGEVVQYSGLPEEYAKGWMNSGVIVKYTPPPVWPIKMNPEAYLKKHPTGKHAELARTLV